MCYKLTRIDGEEDKITSYCFDEYYDAYDFLDKLYGNLCCSDADSGNMTYYDISKISK